MDDDSDDDCWEIMEEMIRDTPVFEMDDGQYRFHVHSPGLINLIIKKGHQIRAYLFDKVREERWEFCYWDPVEKVHQILATCNSDASLPPLSGWDNIDDNIIAGLERFHIQRSIM